MTQPYEHSRHQLRLIVIAGTVLVVASGVFLASRADSHVNRTALSDSPKGVTVVEARASRYRPSRRYVGTVQPWIEARIGPQLVSGYVDTVLVRPGDAVKRGQVIATLDCRNASAASKAVSMQARAIQTEQEAIAHEAGRIAELKEGGFASPNEIEKRAADSASKEAQLLETQARMQRASLEVNDCILRAPFAGEVAARAADPGTFVRPGMAVATLVDRSTVRVIGEVPETDFEVVAVGIAVRVRALATKRELSAKISRRSPTADLSTRTVHIEIDIPDPTRSIPVGTTAELAIDVGEPTPATEVPLVAASVRGSKATIFVVDGQVARKGVYGVRGERDGRLFVDPILAAGGRVVTEGRALLQDGDRVEAKLDPPPTAASPAGSKI